MKITFFERCKIEFFLFSAFDNLSACVFSIVCRCICWIKKCAKSFKILFFIEKNTRFFGFIIVVRTELYSLEKLGGHDSFTGGAVWKVLSTRKCVSKIWWVSYFCADSDGDFFANGFYMWNCVIGLCDFGTPEFLLEVRCSYCINNKHISWQIVGFLL